MIPRLLQDQMPRGGPQKQGCNEVFEGGQPIAVSATVRKSGSLLEKLQGFSQLYDLPVINKFAGCPIVRVHLTGVRIEVRCVTHWVNVPKLLASHRLSAQRRRATLHD